MGTGQICNECGKIWTEEDEKKMQEEIKASMTVEPFKKHGN